MKVLAVCSLGGHLTQMQALLPAFAGHDVAWVTYEGARTRGMASTHLLKNFGRRPHRYVRGLAQAWRILGKERPDLVVSTGSEIALPFFLVARSRGIHTLFIESVTRVRTPSGTGRLLAGVADDLYVQWSELLPAYKGRARYEGGLL
jgi:UDP-N-acetylglucosamine:LPS N-acetylglucosamine transferase